MPVLTYDNIVAYNNITMTVQCTEGDLITAAGALADATDNTKPAVGCASRTVNAADITAGGDRVIVSAYKRCTVNGFTSLTVGARRYLKAATTNGATDTATRPSTAANLIQPVGEALSATVVGYDVGPPMLVVQAVATSTVAFG